MPDKNLPHWRDVHTIVFDFDGVFTDNKVLVDERGVESVCCDRADGLAFDMLRAFMQSKDWPLEFFILSKETNAVVSSRAKKLQVDCVQSVSAKEAYLVDYLEENGLNSEGLVYLGNDLNDLAAMQIAGFSVAPCDAHKLILDQVDLVIPKKGGNGVIRAFIELLIGLPHMSNDELLKLI